MMIAETASTEVGGDKAASPLGPKGRAVMVKRVVEERWSLMEAAAAAGMSERRCAEWVRRTAIVYRR